MNILKCCSLATILLISSTIVNGATKVDDEDDDIHPYINNPTRNRTNAEIEQEKSLDFWKANALNVIAKKLIDPRNLHTAKNVIFFLGDGMSVATVAATRVYLGGEELSLSFEEFPYTALSKTYCVDHQTPDSACSATAYLGGAKANLGTLGVTAAVDKHNCTAMNLEENQVKSLAYWFQKNNKKTGIVTNTRVTHASPAGIYAHTANRHWESDSDVLQDRAKFNEDPSNCKDIAYQLVYSKTGQKLNVILGGGRKNFLPKDVIDEEGHPGKRSDKINLINQWKTLRKSQNEDYEYVWNKQQLLESNRTVDYLLGLFEPGHMQYNLERDPDEDPSLEEMTEAAISVLNNNNPEGFFLFVEGGRIDTAHHRTWAHKALDETVEFSKAVKKAIDLTNEKDTLIVVTADHAHTMSYAGYAARGSEIFGYGGKGSDKNLYTILNYANGPGYKPTTKDGARYIPTLNELNDIHYHWLTSVPREKETHGAEDVAVYARGPWSHLFTGVIEESVIPYLIGFAACVNPDTQCHGKLP